VFLGPAGSKGTTLEAEEESPASIKPQPNFPTSSTNLTEDGCVFLKRYRHEDFTIHLPPDSYKVKIASTPMPLKIRRVLKLPGCFPAENEAWFPKKHLPRLVFRSMTMVVHTERSYLEGRLAYVEGILELLLTDWVRLYDCIQSLKKGCPPIRRIQVLIYPRHLSRSFGALSSYLCGCSSSCCCCCCW